MAEKINVADLIFRPHAIERMAQRTITLLILQAILTKPDGVIFQSRDKRILFKSIRGRKDNLIAIVLIGKSEILTVMNHFEVAR